MEEGNGRGDSSVAVTDHGLVGVEPVLVELGLDGLKR